MLVAACSALTIGLPITSNVITFEILSFFVGVVSVVPQVLLPLAADLAPPHKRASAISVVFSGLLLGILFARVMAGVVANFVSWRIVYWIALGVQASILVLLYLKLPDYPAKNRGMSYYNILFGMGKLAVTEPLLIQSSLINLASMACFTNFWVRPHVLIVSTERVSDWSYAGYSHLPSGRSHLSLQHASIPLIS